MTREELLDGLYEIKNWKCNGDAKTHETITETIKALEKEPKTGQFAKWVATEIFDENWEYNKDAFAELACRKLEKLGIVRAKGDEWELVEPPQESEVSDVDKEKRYFLKALECFKEEHYKEYARLMKEVVDADSN